MRHILCSYLKITWGGTSAVIVCVFRGRALTAEAQRLSFRITTGKPGTVQVPPQDCRVGAQTCPYGPSSIRSDEGLALETLAIVSFTAFHYPHQHTVDTPVCLLIQTRSYTDLLIQQLNVVPVLSQRLHVNLDLSSRKSYHAKRTLSLEPDSRVRDFPFYSHVFKVTTLYSVT